MDLKNTEFKSTKWYGIFPLKMWCKYYVKKIIWGIYSPLNLQYFLGRNFVTQDVTKQVN